MRETDRHIQSLLVICSNVVLVEGIKDLVGTLGLHRDKGEEIDANKLRKKEGFYLILEDSWVCRSVSLVLQVCIFACPCCSFCPT